MNRKPPPLPDPVIMDGADERAELVLSQGVPVTGTIDAGALTQVVELYPQQGAPIVRALVVDCTLHPLHVHFEAASDGTLLVRLTDR